MSDDTTRTQSDDEPGRVREAVGIFSTLEQVRAATHELISLGFATDRLGLLSSAEHFDASPETSAGSGAGSAPEGEWIRRESVGDVAHAGAGAVSLVGTTALGAAVVASAGVLGGAVLAATAGAATVGAVGAAMSGIIHKDKAEYLEEQIDKGRLLLFLRIGAEQDADHASGVMSKHGAINVVEVNFVSPPEH